jgi:hypothetical protein
MKFDAGDSIIVILQNPREKLLGILHEIAPAGIFMRGIDLEYFDDWSRSIAAGEQFLPMNDYFLPMWRIERVTKDEANGEFPSLSEQFESRTGFSLVEY